MGIKFPTVDRSEFQSFNRWALAQLSLITPRNCQCVTITGDRENSCTLTRPSPFHPPKTSIKWPISQHSTFPKLQIVPVAAVLDFTGHFVRLLQQAQADRDEVCEKKRQQNDKNTSGARATSAKSGTHQSIEPFNSALWKHSSTPMSRLVSCAQYAGRRSPQISCARDWSLRLI